MLAITTMNDFTVRAPQIPAGAEPLSWKRASRFLFYRAAAFGSESERSHRSSEVGMGSRPHDERKVTPPEGGTMKNMT